MEHAGDHILITGATGGVGAALAVRLAARGPVVVHGRDPGRLEEARASCGTRFPALAWPADFTADGDPGASLAAFLRGHGARVGALVHAAGCGASAARPAASAEDERRTLAVHLHAGLRLIRALADGGVNGDALRAVVLVTGTCAQRGRPGLAAQAAAFAGLEAAARCLAVELAPRVRVNALALDLGGTQPAGDGDAAALAAHLLGPEARWTTGQTFTLDGGKSVTT